MCCTSTPLPLQSPEHGQFNVAAPHSFDRLPKCCHRTISINNEHIMFLCNGSIARRYGPASVAFQLKFTSKFMASKVFCIAHHREAIQQCAGKKSIRECEFERFSPHVFSYLCACERVSVSSVSPFVLLQPRENERMNRHKIKMKHRGIGVHAASERETLA